MLLLEKVQAYNNNLIRCRNFTELDFYCEKKKYVKIELVDLLDIADDMERLLEQYDYQNRYFKRSDILEQLLEIKMQSENDYDAIECYERVVYVYYSIIGFAVDEITSRDCDYLYETYSSIDDVVRVCEKDDTIKIYQQELMRRWQEMVAKPEVVIYPIDKKLCQCFMYGFDKITDAEELKGKIIQAMYFLKGLEYEFTLYRNAEERKSILVKEVEIICHSLNCPF